MEVIDLIRKPILSEKTSFLTEKNNTYCFEVNYLANKHQIRVAIESLFDVRVVKINSLVQNKKVIRFGRFSKEKSNTKRVYVQIKEGQKIQLFKDL